MPKAQLSTKLYTPTFTYMYLILLSHLKFGIMHVDSYFGGKLWDDLAPRRHVIEDLSRENELLHVARNLPILELYGCFHLSESCEARRL